MGKQRETRVYKTLARFTKLGGLIHIENCFSFFSWGNKYSQKFGDSIRIRRKTFFLDVAIEIKDTMFLIPCFSL